MLPCKYFDVPVTTGIVTLFLDNFYKVFKITFCYLIATNCFASTLDSQSAFDNLTNRASDNGSTNRRIEKINYLTGFEIQIGVDKQIQL